MIMKCQEVDDPVTATIINPPPITINKEDSSW